MTDTNSTYLTNLLSSRPDVSATEAARIIGVARPYIYELAKSCGFQRVSGQWVTAEDVERQGDALFQMVAEIHEATVGRKRSPEVVVLPDTPHEPEREEPKTQPLESWKIQDKKLIIPIQFEKGYPEAEDIQYWADRLASIPTMSREQAQTILLFVANLAVRRMAELKSNNKE